jgi:hypothetical protein
VIRDDNEEWVGASATISSFSDIHTLLANHHPLLSSAFADQWNAGGNSQGLPERYPRVRESPRLTQAPARGSPAGVSVVTARSDPPLLLLRKTTNIISSSTKSVDLKSAPFLSIPQTTVIFLDSSLSELLDIMICFIFPLCFLVLFITDIQAHTWIEQISVMNETNGLMGTPEYPRGFDLSSYFFYLNCD